MQQMNKPPNRWLSSVATVSIKGPYVSPQVRTTLSCCLTKYSCYQELKLISSCARKFFTYGSTSTSHCHLVALCATHKALRKMEWTKRISLMRELRKVYRILVRKYERKKLLGRLRRRWERRNSLVVNRIGLTQMERDHFVQNTY
jgi:hypothetical protein